MRVVRLVVPDENRVVVIQTLEEMNADYVVTSEESDASETAWLVEFPVPVDAVGEVLSALRDAGADLDRYTVVSTAEVAMTPATESLQERYAASYDPIWGPELRSKARDLTRNPVSFVALLITSAVIAAAGILAQSPAVIVGAMVIAPLVGPVLATSVGAVTGERSMARTNLRLQVFGLGIAVLAATLFSILVRYLGLVPADLATASLDPVATRLAPTFLSLAVGVASGAAAAFGITTKGPLSLIGVMIAAALVPAAAVVGIAVAWGQPLVGIGTLLLLLATVAAINLTVYVSLRLLGYSKSVDVATAERSSRLADYALAALLVVAVVAVGAASYQQVAFDREAHQAVGEVVEQSPYDQYDVVAVRPEYAGPTLLPISEPKRVRVVLSTGSGDDAPGLASAVADRIAGRTGHAVTVSVQVQAYRTAASNATTTRTATRVRTPPPRWPRPGRPGRSLPR